MVFQSYTLFPGSPCARTSASVWSVDAASAADEIAAHYIARVGLAGFEHHIEVLSGGMAAHAMPARW
jgi:ABC-type proline/glycine betaine transport system ATPase subunit